MFHIMILENFSVLANVLYKLSSGGITFHIFFLIFLLILFAFKTVSFTFLGDVEGGGQKYYLCFVFGERD